MSRGITLRGDAARAFVEGMTGVLPTTDDDRAMRIATFIHLNMSRGGDQTKAIALIKLVARDGLEAVANGLTDERRPTTPP